MRVEVDSGFRGSDKKSYELITNSDFLNQLELAINNGYECFMSAQELQEMINKIVSWYEFKYPEREMEYYEGIKCDYFNDIRKLSTNMNIKQLLYRLTKKEFCLIESAYRSPDMGLKAVYENGKKVGMKEFIVIRIRCNPDDPLYQKHTYFKIIADPKTGIVEDDQDLSDYINMYEGITLDEVLSSLIPYERMLDLSNLKNSVFNHTCDISLRNKMLEFISLKLIYSINTTIRHGIARARRFISEVNKNLNINISSDFIDEIKKKYDEMQKKWHGTMPVADEKNVSPESFTIVKRTTHP